ncbi:MAG: GNAT family N-acetyltransferase [Cognatishimia sp.]|uniref:GNAT family N-acetyltransferase n=1 Tax=Cognatishimia sp. 1_MG-2023 TaxID=3062642 RepID=UPI0026E250DE|nr:GNAT family N-acetyltransferase [Cognatishimia sp. 1_MG-2023]MDO6726163.1 GNAT family N-acetyltransferase [Cognatishimia sp. 1_MG-2023]
MTPESLSKIHKAAFNDSRPWESSEFASFLESPLCFCEGDSRGFALGRVIADESELLTLAVDPEFQGLGLGRLFLNQYHETAKLRGATTTFLEVAADNAVAINIYLSNDYKTNSTRPEYYARTNGDKVDALIMSRSL